MSVTETASSGEARSAPSIDAIGRRRTFAIISHPDAGKTTLTEKLLLYGGTIHLAGSVKSRKTDRHATSDWMALKKERGISVTSSVMHPSARPAMTRLLNEQSASFSGDVIVCTAHMAKASSSIT